MSTSHNIELRYKPLVHALIDAGLVTHWNILRLRPVYH